MLKEAIKKNSPHPTRHNKLQQVQLTAVNRKCIRFKSGDKTSVK